MTVDEILRSKGHAVVTIGPDATVAEAVGLLDRHRIGAVVVTGEGHRVIGLLGEQDVVRALARTGPAVLRQTVGSVMSTDVVTCALGDRITKVMALMTDRRQRHVPVVQDDDLDGIVSIGDLVKARLSELELESRVLRDAWLVHR
jgi:CBS domain-containing protein